jgi:glycine/D-amino acid oxidase-like deaminating enzyme
MGIDYLIAGGGLVGAAVACGLARCGNKVAVLDEGDSAFRASRGNFGLVWVQGKGAAHPAYAQWTGYAADLWPEFDQSLRGDTGVDTGYCRPGGMEFCLSEDEWQARSREMANVRKHTSDRFEYEMLDHAALKKRIPQIGDDVLGASYSPQDGHVNPLYLLRALHQQMDALGIDYRTIEHINRIDHRGDEFIAYTQQSTVAAGKIVLCAGLDNQRLGKMLHMHVPVDAVRGQILITERLQPFLHYPTLHVRQTQEGGLQIGDSHEHVGLDDGTSGEIMAKIARRAVRLFPLLESVQLVRAWGALRVMTSDGYPIYQQSTNCPGAFAISTHSGVTLAAAHAGPVAQWIGGGAHNELLQHFTSERFDVAAA